MEITEGACLEAGLVRGLDKSFRGSLDFKAWGAEVRGGWGLCGPPLSTSRHLWTLLRAQVQAGVTTKVLERILGFAAFVLGFKKETFATLQEVYRFCASPRKRLASYPLSHRG